MSPAASAQQPVSLVDAVCCVHFCAAGRSQLLLDVLTASDMEILIPGEVDEEVQNKSGFKTPEVALAEVQAGAERAGTSEAEG